MSTLCREKNQNKNKQIRVDKETKDENKLKDLSIYLGVRTHTNSAHIYTQM